MKDKFNSQERGFVGTIVLVVIALAALKYFLNWSVFDAAASNQGQSTIGYIRDVFNIVWNYIAAPLTFVWHQVLEPLLNVIWISFKAVLEMGKSTAQGVSQ